MALFDELLGSGDGGGVPPMPSVTTGKVVENWDDKHPGMVRVEIFLGESGQNETDWIRVAQPYAGKGCGSYFLPEVGDEVVLGFNQGDRNHPLVIGSLWNQVDTLPEETAREKNDVKRIKTKGGHELVFTEESGKETLTLHTPGKLTLTMADEKKLITVQDADGKNLVVIDGDKGTVTVTAEKKLLLDVGSGSLLLDGQGKKATLKMDTINIEANQNLNLKGQNVKLDGSMMKINSSGNLEAKAGGILTLKGSMTKIN
ncbi:MAG: phage baseplate assembly protein V [Oscillospiraceae bacterium]